MKFQTVLLALAAFLLAGVAPATARGAKRGHNPWNGNRSLGRGGARPKVVVDGPQRGVAHGYQRRSGALHAAEHAGWTIQYSCRCEAVLSLTQIRRRRASGPGEPAVDIALQIAQEAQQVSVTEQADRGASTDASSNVERAGFEGSGHRCVCRTIQTICNRIWRRWRVQQRVPMERSFSSTASAAGNCRRRVRSAKSASIRIRFLPSSIPRVSEDRNPDPARNG